MANVDTAEIAKFEALASRWWDKNSEFKPLHDIHPLRANYIDHRSPVAQRKVIDVGVGGVCLSYCLAQRCADRHCHRSRFLPRCLPMEDRSIHVDP